MLQLYDTSPSAPIKSRRQFLQTQILTSTLTTLLPTQTNAAATTDGVSNYFSLTNNNNVSPYAQKKQQAWQNQKEAKQLADRQQKVLNTAGSKKWVPFNNVNKWDTVETCLLEMLPVKNAVFRRLQELIEGLEVCSPNDSEGWIQTVLDTLTTLSLLESKRSSLEPVFNQEDPTELFISKSSIGERNIETLRNKLEDLVRIASGGTDIDIEVSRQNKGNVNFIPLNNVENLPVIDAEAFLDVKKQALFALAEVGELLVASYPYQIPSRGKFGYLPRLLGRCTITFSFERPSTAASTLGFGLFSDSIAESKRLLGNVTIVADGYAAPITAGNFVDLSMRNFYTGLSVKAMRKRLGVVPSWSDNVIVNDLTELKDNFDVIADDFGSDLTIAEKKLGLFQSKHVDTPSYEYESSETMDAVIPILGSFQEGFYDPLTAKPRRIPLELVTLDPSSPSKTTLTYSSSFAPLDVNMAGSGTTTYSAVASSSSRQRSFSSAISSTSSNSTISASSKNLNPVLSFDIPNIVALNHPDRVSNGGSSEFFALPSRDISPKKTILLDGQYAPFGYIVKGSDVYNSLRPGDVIKATYVSELGQLNLVKIRKNAFEGGDDDEEKVPEEDEEKET
jgi:cyclophilin family peptidyl-prolyl cis-trans isomerase